MDDRIDYVPVGAIAALHVDVSLFVGRAPFVRETIQRGPGIVISELGAGIAPRGALRENVDRRVEPDGDCAFVEQLPSARIDIGAAAGGDHAQVALDQACDQSPLAVTKIILAKPLEDFCGRKSRRVFDFGIAVDECQAQTLGQASTHRRFSDPHQPDQHHGTIETLRQFMHRKGYTAAPPLGKSARMSRLLVLIIVIVLVLGALFYLSTVPKQQPTHTIEVAVPQGATNGGNAH